MPTWVSGVGKNNYFYVPEEAIVEKLDGFMDWQKVDWWLASFLYIECIHERCWEYLYGPIHSYSNRLKGWDEKIWTYAWVNRIAIFLGKWASIEEALWIKNYKYQENIRMTHDLDAIQLTLPIVLKQISLNLFRFFQFFLKAKLIISFKKLISALDFLCKKGNWNNFDEIILAERCLRIKPLINIYAGLNYKNPITWLLDPGYKINSPEIKKLINIFKNEDWEIGLHPSFFSFNSTKDLFFEKKRLEEIVGKEVKNVRQHWLRFSWEKTWKSQTKAGLKSDFTLMFNDRYGFRNSTALSFSSYYETDTHQSSSSSFMDALKDRDNSFDKIISELNACYGETNILWHNHTLSSNYGWYDSWKRCLNILKI